MITIQLMKQATAALALWRKSRNQHLSSALQRIAARVAER